MATSFPTNIDTFTNPAADDKRSSPSHAAQHANVNDAVEALEAKVGKNSSAVTTSHDYKLSGVTGSDKAVSLTGTETLTNKTLTSPKINENVAVTVTATELNKLDGVTATAAELNITDGGSADEKALNVQCKCNAYLNSDQLNITTGAYTLVNLDAEGYDIGGNFNTTTHLFTAPVNGYYLVNGQVGWINKVGNWYAALLYVAGIAAARSFTNYAAGSMSHVPVTKIFHLTASQTVGLYCYTNDGASTADLMNDKPYDTFMDIHLLSV